jgi:signal transduction histidine kinase
MREETVKTPAKPRHRLLHAAAYVNAVGVAVAEVLDLGRSPRLVPTLALLACFMVMLFATLQFVYWRRKGPFIASAIVLSGLAAGVMLTGAGTHYGAILFFIVCALPSMRFSPPAALAWDGLAVACLAGCTFLRHETVWASTLLGFGAGYVAFTAFALSIRQAQQARAESQHLLAQLTAAQGRMRDLAVLEERQRLAREMHDAVGHRLTASAVLLEGAARLIPTDPERAARMVSTSRDQVREGLSELRAAVTALREEEAQGSGLAEVLRALVDVSALATDARVSLALPDGVEEPDPERKMVIIRTAQEALTNAQKHAAASRVELRLERRPGAWVLTCADDGRGPGVERGAGGGFGLGSLGSRAASFGGSVSLQPGPAGGAVLTLTLPSGTGAAHA